MADHADQLATVAELSTWMGASFDAEDVARAEFILRVGSGWARQIAGKLWPNRDAPDFPITVRGIILGAARREFENPRRVIYEVKGPESSTYHNQQYAPGFFTEAEEKVLKRFRPGGGLFSVSTYRDDPVFALGYIGMGNGSKPLPYFNPGDPGWEESEHL
ncbi:head-to-tail adaptor [Mycobacterium phage Skinny]|uniref:Head-to-tail adaptor n=5 Tax=Bongovirus bongo TaxID=1983750 RepID=A0A0M4S365_9CAUD|nr:head-to-tail adaptor [Mycobacterium phage PegLeg]YP_009604877.1 hypothetical protein FDH95_gp019 [Mycobacterium phage Bongo]ALF00547.1 head-to-tail adaptor [Mycobacterium phage Bricole]AXQ52660.1 head-to-tail adaptor [Mycobacterium phage IPhane7]QDH93592.1 head-to-tail adaptor [Mycobacterium phage LilhomieP]QUU29219.1 head-to-tail adaptor [Mycobacterium phage SirSheldon]UXE05227.1 head-to-tail adaptor [Mycobacterium phage Skinny]WMI33200.1 head-to-tail adaptor [Mycobacterium phage SlimJim